jgi:hypothetical protein
MITIRLLIPATFAALLAFTQPFYFAPEQQSNRTAHNHKLPPP